MICHRKLKPLKQKENTLEDITLGVVDPGAQSTSFISLLSLGSSLLQEDLLSGSTRWQVQVQLNTWKGFYSPKSSHKSSGPDYLCFIIGPHTHLNQPQRLGKRNAALRRGQPHDPQDLGVVPTLVPQ